MTLSTTGHRLYIIALSTLERLEIQFVPSMLSINRDPTVQQVEIVGANLPRTQQQGGGRTLTLDLDFYADDNDRMQAIKKCRQLESYTYREGQRKPAEKVRLIFGDMFQQEIWSVQKVSYDLKQFHKLHGFLPVQAYAKVTLIQDGSLEPSASSVRII